MDRVTETRPEDAGVKLPDIGEIEAIRVKAERMRAEFIGEQVSHLVLWVARGVAKAVRPLTTWIRQARVYDELMALDDRALRDIGLTRADIPAVAAGTFVSNREPAVRVVAPAGLKAANDTGSLQAA